MRNFALCQSCFNESLSEDEFNDSPFCESCQNKREVTRLEDCKNEQDFNDHMRYGDCPDDAFQYLYVAEMLPVKGVLE